MNKRKVLAVWLAAVILLFVLPFAAFAAEDGMYEYNVNTDNNAVITAYLGSGTAAVTLPSYLGGHPVVGIDENAFGKLGGDTKPHAEITSVTIPSGVSYIGDRALAGTAWFDSPAAGDGQGFVIVNGMLINYVGNEKNVKVPDSVKVVNYGAFEKDAVESVTLPSSVTEIKDYAFYRCSALREIVIEGAITSIGKSAFNDCSSLREIYASDRSVMPDSLKSVGANAFYNCASLDGVIDLGYGVESVGANAFANCATLDGIRVPDTVKTIGSYAFGFTLIRENNTYVAKQNHSFVIYVSHKAADDPAEETEILKTYSKNSAAISSYAHDPEGSGYFDSFRLVWDRLAYPFAIGDVNNDGKVNSSDARVVLRHSARLELIEHEDDQRAADLNGDGRINTSDARLLLRKVAGLD